MQQKFLLCDITFCNLYLYEASLIIWLYWKIKIVDFLLCNITQYIMQQKFLLYDITFCNLDLYEALLMVWLYRKIR